jgi:hypothetical protein
MVVVSHDVDDDPKSYDFPVEGMEMAKKGSMRESQNRLGGTQMTARTAGTSPNVYARVAGILYLIIFIAAVFGPLYVRSVLIVPGDATTTANNILASGSLFRAGIVSYLIIFLSELVLTVILYVLLKPVSKTLALVMTVPRLAMTTIHGVNLLNQFFALLLLSGADYLTVFEADQLHALALLFLNAHELGWSIGIVIFSLHVFVLGYLVYKSGYLPRILGILLLLASVAYLVDGLAILILPSYEETPIYIMIPIAAAEMLFPLWLLIKGVDVDLYHK